MNQDKSQDQLKAEQGKVSPLGNFSRRTFLKNTGAACVLLFGVGGAGKLLKKKDLLRPPGGQDEVSFMSRCLKCDRCRSICPQSAIDLANLSDSILDTRTPVMNFHRGYCDFCNKCVEVCPTHALKPFHTSTVRIGQAVVKKDICIAWNTGGCTICANKCPKKAITLDEQKHPVVDIRKCNGCGICEHDCPALVARSYIGGKVRGIVVTPVPHELKVAELIRSSINLGGDRV